MKYCRADSTHPKGWYIGPWNSRIPIPIGYATEGIAELHRHEQMYEAYMVACGKSVAEVDGQRVSLRAGDVLVVEPNEVHTFVESYEGDLAGPLSDCVGGVPPTSCPVSQP